MKFLSSHFHAAAPTWLAEQRAANGTESGGIFPWTDEPSDDNHHGMANLGQPKAVFSLHFTRDTDGDGLPDSANTSSVPIPPCLVMGICG